MTSPSPDVRTLPLIPELHGDEPLRSLLLRTASQLGLDLVVLCEQVGSFDGDPKRWPAFQVNLTGAERVASLYGTDRGWLAALVPELADATEALCTPRLRRRPLPRPWFTCGMASCGDCLSQRDGAARKQWENPWSLVCLDHGRPLRPGYIDSLDDATEVIEAQRHLTAMVSASPACASAAAPIVWELVTRRAQRGPLHELAIDRMQRACPSLRRKPVLPMLPIELLLLPEIARALERIILNWPDWVAADGAARRRLEAEFVGTM